MAKMKATCVRRTHRDEHLIHTYYRVSGGQGLQVQKLGAPKFYRDVVVSTSTIGSRPETMIFAANKDGKIKHTSRGHLVTLWGGEIGTKSASTVLKNAGVGEITACPNTAPSDFDGRKRRRRRRR